MGLVNDFFEFFFYWLGFLLCRFLEFKDYKSLIFLFIDYILLG